CAAENGARHARQISARRAGGGTLCARQSQARGAAERGAGGSDVRLRARRPVVGRLTRPARRTGLGGDGADGACVERAADQGAVISYPSPARGGWRAISAFTRVFDALWRAGWGLRAAERRPHPFGLRPNTLPLRGRDNYRSS